MREASICVISVFSSCIPKRIGKPTPACAFYPTGIFHNSSKFTKISADDQKPSPTNPEEFFHTQCRLALFVLILSRNKCRIPRVCGCNTRPFVLSVFFFRSYYQQQQTVLHLPLLFGRCAGHSCFVPYLVEVICMKIMNLNQKKEDAVSPVIGIFLLFVGGCVFASTTY